MTEARQMRPQLLTFASVLLIFSAAGCGASGNSANRASGTTEVEQTALAKLSLSSHACADGQPIPTRFTCDGPGQSPPLAWGEPPAGTKSFAVIADDPDAPSGLFRHWGAFDIPASTRSIGQGQSIGSQAINEFGKPGYGGPCPPPGHGPHHYHFKLYALDVEKLGLAAGAKVEQVESEAQKHAIARGVLVGTYERR